MKKLITLLLTFVIAFTLVSCEKVHTTPMNIATLKGPTGMGMVQLMDKEEYYNISLYQNPTDAVSKLLNTDIDVAALPSNLAPVLYNKTKGNVVILTPVTLGVLYMLEKGDSINSVSDLKGRTIVASGKGSTPEYVLEKVLKANNLTIGKDVKVKWLSNHNDVVQMLLSKDDVVAMVPEPFVSVVKVKTNDNVKIALDMNALWKKVTNQDLPMGVLVANKEYVNSHEDEISDLLEDLKESTFFVNNNQKEGAKLIAQQGILDNEKIALKSISRCNIVTYVDDKKQDGIDMLKEFYQSLYELNPTSVGGKLPNEEIYY